MCSKVVLRYLGAHLSLSCRLFCSLETLGVLGNLELVDDVLDRSVHEDRKVVHRVVDTVVGHTGLRIVVCTDLCRTVTTGYHGLSL